MSESPMRPQSLVVPQTLLRIYGGDGEGNEPGGEGGQGAQGGNQPGSNEGGKPGGNDDVDARIRDLEKRASDADKARKDERKRAEALEKQLRDRDLEGADDVERATAEATEYKEKYEKLAAIIETSYLDSAILKLSQGRNKDGSPKYDWQDVEAVRVFLDMEQITVDLDTGDVDGLDKQLSEIAKSRPYLLVQPKQPGGQQNFAPPAGPPSGNSPVGGGTRQRETDKNKIAKKFKFDHLIAGGSPR